MSSQLQSLDASLLQKAEDPASPVSQASSPTNRIAEADAQKPLHVDCLLDNLPCGMSHWVSMCEVVASSSKKAKVITVNPTDSSVIIQINSTAGGEKVLLVGKKSAKYHTGLEIPPEDVTFIYTMYAFGRAEEASRLKLCCPMDRGASPAVCMFHRAFTNDSVSETANALPPGSVPSQTPAKDPRKSVFVGLRYLSSKSRGVPTEEVLVLHCESEPEGAVVLMHLLRSAMEANGLAPDCGEWSKIRSALTLQREIEAFNSRVNRKYISAVLKSLVGSARDAVPMVAVPNQLVLAMRRAVSRKKQRYEEDGFNLDLAYITPHIIAMGYPAKGKESWYRNSMEETLCFFERYFGARRGAGAKPNYRIFNLCSERCYAPTAFGGEFERFAFDDHEAPPLQLIDDFVRSAEDFFRQKEAEGARSYAVGVHCKAGKGRTGIMIVALLLHMNICATIDEAIALYDSKRTHNSKGVSIASQHRFLQYFCQINKELGGVMPRRRPASLQSVTMFTTPYFDLDGGCTPYVVVEMRKTNHRHVALGRREVLCHGEIVKLLDTRDRDEPRKIVGEDFTVFSLNSVVVASEVRITLFTRRSLLLLQVTDEKMCSFWIHTSFLDATAGTLTLGKNEIDGASKDLKHLFDPNFSILLEFTALRPEG